MLLAAVVEAVAVAEAEDAVVGGVAREEVWDSGSAAVAVVAVAAVVGGGQR